MNNVPRNTQYAGVYPEFIPESLPLDSQQGNFSSLAFLSGAILDTKIQSTKEYVRNYKLFMQNKPNFRKSQMNVNIYATKDYGNISDWTLGQSKPNSNPIFLRTKRMQPSLPQRIT